MAESLQGQHPDVAKITWKWGRYQHQVDYRSFKRNRPILKPSAIIPEGVNDYGMVLEVDPEPAEKIHALRAPVEMDFDSWSSIAPRRELGAA